MGDAATAAGRLENCARGRKTREHTDDVIPQPTILRLLWVATHIKEMHRDANLLKRWWPGTELNRRRQPFQSVYNQCF